VLLLSGFSYAFSEPTMSVPVEQKKDSWDECKELLKKVKEKKKKKKQENKDSTEKKDE